MEVNLGAIRFNWKGAYAGATAYVADDVVSSGGASYICILASTGNATSNATYWSVMSSAGTNGTNGTDVGTTITTQGDLLFRDGSGLQRLAKGTAAQVLAMNAGATAPEWQAAAGGAWNFISSASPTSEANVDFTVSNTYGIYVVSFMDLVGSNTSENLYLRTSSDAGSSYDSGGTDYNWHYSHSGTGSTGYDAYNNTGANFMALTYGPGSGASSIYSINGFLYCYNPSGTVKHKHFNWMTTNLDNSGELRASDGLGSRRSIADIDRLRFYWNNGTFTGGTIRLYGIANS